MKILLTSVTAWFLFTVTAFAQEDVSASKWQDRQIVIDGNNKDWGQPFNFFDNNSGLIFTISNDGKNIYLCFSNNDRIKASKMMAAGWSVQLISSEKKRKFEASISFPRSTDPNVNTRPEFRTTVGIYQKEIQTVNAKGFLLHNGELPLLNKDGIDIGIGTDSTGKIIYEIKIPVKELMEEDKIQLNEVVTLDITINGEDKPAGQTASPTARAAFSGGGRGGGRMGGRGGARSGSQGFDNSASADRFDLYKKDSFKQKIRLVSK